jgi:hypothetical protein
VYGRLGARELGPVEEYRAWIRPWGFAPEELTVPVDVWAGTRDELVNPTWPHRFASRIPNATLNIRDGGPLIARRYYREIFEALMR